MRPVVNCLGIMWVMFGLMAFVLDELASWAPSNWMVLGMVMLTGGGVTIIAANVPRPHRQENEEPRHGSNHHG